MSTDEDFDPWVTHEAAPSNGIGADPWGMEPDTEPADPDADYEAAAAFTREVNLEANRIRVREAARAKVAAENTPEAPPFDDGLLADILARPAEPPYRVEDLIPSDAGTLVVAQRKTGKTTLMLNLARSMLTGATFLGRFGVRPVTGNVALFNFEVSGATVSHWAHDAGIPHNRLYLVNLRGRRNPLGNDDDREQLARRLAAHDIESLFVDPFGRAYTGTNQNDPGEVGAWLADLDRFARGAGVIDVVLSTHAGWDAERTRGSTAQEDWADSIITMTRNKNEDDDSRFLRALGRDVEVEEDELLYDYGTRSLSLSGHGSRKVAAMTKHLEELVTGVVALAGKTPGITGYRLAAGLREAGMAFQKGDERKAASLAVDRGLLQVEPGPRNAKCYFVPDDPHLPRRTPTYPDGGTSPPTPTPLIYRGVGGVGQVDDLPHPGQVGICPDCGSLIPDNHFRCLDCAQQIIDAERTS